jgi:hypothetical protein
MGGYKLVLRVGIGGLAASLCLLLAAASASAFTMV